MFRYVTPRYESFSML